MNKSLLLLFFILSFRIISYSQIIEAPDTIKGGFSQCLIREYNIINGNIDTLKPSKQTNANYNSKGRKISEVNYIGNNLYYKKYYSYNDSGTVLVADTTYREFGFVYYDKYYFENDRLILHERWSDENSQYPNSAFAIWTNTFNNEGKLISEKYWTYDMSFNYQTTYTYNDAGKLVEELSDRIYYKNKSLYEYNSQGKRIKSQKFSDENTLISSDSMFYDSTGNIIEIGFYSQEGILQNKEMYSYDSKGNQIEYVRYVFPQTNSQSRESESGRKIEFKKKSLYNAENKLVEETFTSETGDMENSKKTYKYDEAGNLTELTKFNSKNEIRNITFYTFRK